MINDFLLVGHCMYSCMLYHFQIIWRWIMMILKRSLKVIQTGTIRKIGCGFLFAFHSNYGHIFNRLWDIQRQRIAWPLKLFKGYSKSLKTAPFDRSHTNFYWSVIVIIAQSCTVLSYLTLNNIVTLKSGLEVTQGHLNWYHSKAYVRRTVSYSRSIVTMALCCIVCEI